MEIPIDKYRHQPNPNIRCVYMYSDVKRCDETWTFRCAGCDKFFCGSHALAFWMPKLRIRYLDGKQFQYSVCGKCHGDSKMMEIIQKDADDYISKNRSKFNELCSNRNGVCDKIGNLRCLGCGKFSCRSHSVHCTILARNMPIPIDDETVEYDQCDTCYNDIGKRKAINETASNILKANLERSK